MQEQTLMKDGLGADAIKRMSKVLTRIVPEFPAKQFQKAASTGLAELELKQRVDHLIAVLHQFFPQDFKQTAKILLAVKDHWDEGDPDDPLRGFAAWPLIDYVAVHGLQQPKIALNVLQNLTALFSAEFAIRPFIMNHYDLTYELLQKWSLHKDEYVRRLASEGTRPRLPWGKQLPEFIKDPSPVLQLLEEFKDDSSEMVRRSVANNLNDISKDHPQSVIKICKQWSKNASKERQWLIRHALRSLIKAGHAEVFPLLGYTESPKLTIEQFKLEKKKIELGDAVKFSFCLKSNARQSQKIVVDYAIHHVKANQTLKAKVFKLKSIDLKPGQPVEIFKQHAIEQITTRKYYSGQHELDIMINGRPVAKEFFKLIV